ncbi:hypothetical protein Athai_16650 [Actinocatenispora thailandica]|uniref:DUF5134 domain-containing protein n=1 Tax=Actinocatenispora thailandica TaxID=227318 RepID=A0A7R7HVH5_9ACTN|nr:DUF5134 domain-containing protein [Actinocatenispora thailandica]BCJ34162.1 hypothetical protein Athai_16650 [Actinocatenispora thailandica]
MTTMTNAWLPTWLKVLATTLFVIVAVAHAVHLRHGSRESRVWHAGHVLMALGMIDMSLPLSRTPVPAVVGEAVFATCTVLALGAGLVQLGRHRRCLPWLLAAVSQAGMLCMFAMPVAGFVLLIWVLIGWFGLEAVGWIAGVLPSLDAPARIAIRVAGLRLEPAPVPASAGAAAVGVVDRTATEPAAGASRDRHDLALRATLALMALGMAYMLLAMQLGMPHPSSTENGGMTGM